MIPIFKVISYISRRDLSPLSRESCRFRWASCCMRPREINGHEILLRGSWRIVAWCSSPQPEMKRTIVNKFIKPQMLNVWNIQEYSKTYIYHKAIKISEHRPPSQLMAGLCLVAWDSNFHLWASICTLY